MTFDGMMDDTCMHCTELGRPCDKCIGGIAIQASVESEPAKTAAVDDARNPIPPDLRWLDGLDNELIERVLGAESKLSDLEAQLRQEREAKEAAYAEVDRLGKILLSENRLANKSGWDALQAQVSQLQTTVGQLARTLKDLRPFQHPDSNCQKWIDTALATCPAPAKEGE